MIAQQPVSQKLPWTLTCVITAADAAWKIWKIAQINEATSVAKFMFWRLVGFSATVQR